MENEFERSYVNGDLSDDQVQSIGDVLPQDVWMSAGKLLVLKGSGATSRAGVYDPWEPLDDYQETKSQSTNTKHLPHSFF